MLLLCGVFFLIHLSQLSFKTCGQLLYSHMVKWSKSELLSNCPPAARLLCPWSRPQQVMRKAWEQAGRRMRHREARAERNKDFQYITLTVKSGGKVTSGYERLYIFLFPNLHTFFPSEMQMEPGCSQRRSPPLQPAAVAGAAEGLHLFTCVGRSC